jgi:hypothetical protein
MCGGWGDAGKRATKERGKGGKEERRKAREKVNKKLCGE